VPERKIIKIMNDCISTVLRSIGAKRFTLDGSIDLERQLARTCEKVLAGIQRVVPRRKLEALLLGGGYGRGEGGVLKTQAGDQPYNDLEFYVFIQGNTWLNEKLFGAALHPLSHELTVEAGVEVEFKIISPAKLRGSPPSMFYYDLLMGHRRLFGNDKLLAGCEHHCQARNIPSSEATRLLMNRCSGLLFAREKMGRKPFTAEDADFVGRNLAKAQLALGDAVLAVFGEYHWSCRERHARLQQLSVAHEFPRVAEVCQQHALGMEFKLHPVLTRSTVVELQSRHDEINQLALELWLWVESRRLGRPFHCAEEYASSLTDKFPGTNPWRNRFVNAKAFGPAALFRKYGHRHPRERVLNALARLLWTASGPNAKIQNGDSMRVYQEIWNQCK
jgi:hypothetical protein